MQAVASFAFILIVAIITGLVAVYRSSDSESSATPENSDDIIDVPAEEDLGDSAKLSEPESTPQDEDQQP